MAIPRIGGLGLPLNLNGALGSQIPNPTPSSSFSNPITATNAVTLSAGESIILPAGTYQVLPGPYTSLQFLDPVTGFWRNFYSGSNSDLIRVDSDAGNIRLANLTGLPVGALITNSGTGATNGIGTAVTGITVTASTGGSIWVPVVGGAINSTVTITTPGTGYTLPPILVFAAPPTGGIQATGVCTISGGAIATVTVTNQGAGYTAAPGIAVLNDPRDNVGSGGALTVNATLANSGGLTAVYPAFLTGNLGAGNPVTTLPTLSFTGTGSGSMAATVVMNWVVTSIGVTNPGAGGTGWATPTTAMVISGALTAGTRASNVAGPIADTGLTQPRPAFIQMALSVGTINTTGHIVIDAGYGFQAVPSVNLINAGAGAVAQNPAAAVNAQVGGITDTSWVQPF